MNPGSARSCDCGYSFADGSLGAPLDLGKPGHAPPAGRSFGMRIVAIFVAVASALLARACVAYFMHH